MKTLRRSAALFLSFIMLCQLLPVSAFAAGTAEYHAPSAVYSVTFGEDTYLITGGYTISELPEPPAEEGKVFLGWYDGDTKVEAPFTPTGDVRLTAKYEELAEDLGQRTLVESLNSGAVISLTGAIPEGLELTVDEPVETVRFRARSAGGMFVPMALYTYALSLKNADGTDYELEDGPITVTVRGQKFVDALAAGRSIHLTEGSGEEITDLQVNGDTVTFTINRLSSFRFTGNYDLVEWESALKAGDVDISLSGTMPNGAKAEVIPVSPVVADSAVLAAADITLLNSGVDVEPASWGSELMVTMTNEAIAAARSEGKELHVVHIADDGMQTQLNDDLLSFTDNSITFPASQFSVYAVIGGREPTARIKVIFHAYDENGTEKDTIMYVKQNDTAEDLETILYDPGVGKLNEGETFRGWTQNVDYTVAMATSVYNKNTNPNGAMTIQNVREWAQDLQAEGITETVPLTEYHFYPMIVKHFTVLYLDRFGIALDSDSAFMLRNDTTAQYTVNMNYETNDDDYHFKGWITETENLITDANPTPAVVTIQVANEDKDYKLYTNNTTIKLNGDVEFKAHAPKGKWLIFHEVMKGATYVAPQFLEEGDSPVMPEPSQMLLLGYTFDGWYKTYSETTDPVTGEVTRTYSDPFTPGPITVKTNIYAKWKSATLAPYTVIIWKQNLDGRYSYVESVRLAGAVNANIQALNHLHIQENNDADYLRIAGTQLNNDETALVNYSKTYHIVHSRTGRGNTDNPYVHHYYTEGTTEESDYVGFNCARIEYENETIKPEGTSVVNVYYDRITYKVRIYYARQNINTNAYYIATGRNNEATNPIGPSSTDFGMTFAPGAVLWHRVDNGWAEGYHSHPEGSNSVVSGDYRYYYTTITAKYGENIAAQWPKYSSFPDLDTDATHTSNNNNSSGYYAFVSWYMMNDAAGYRGTGSGLNTFKGVISKMDEKILGDITRGADGVNVLFGRYDTRPINIYTYRIWKEALVDDDGNPIIPAGKEQRVGPDGLVYYLDESIQANSNAQPSGTQAPNYIGFENFQTDKPADNNQAGRREDIICWYHRVKNPIIYRDGSYFDGNGNRLNAYPPNGQQQESDPIPYQTNIESYNGGYTNDGVLIHGDNYKLDYPPSYPGFVFEGWYTDEACTNAYTFNTMPDTSITVYAKFRQVQYRVFLHPNVPTGKYVTWGSASQQMNFRGTYGTNISLPTGKLITSEETPESYDDSYEFAGWYRDDEPFKKPFDPDAYVLTDDLAVPYDKTVDMTDNMDKYGNITNPPGTNSDITGNNGGDRWWITKKIDLYGKWIKKLDEGAGIQVIYDPNGGSTEVKDDTLYKDGTSAVAQSAPATSPTTTITNPDGTTSTVDKVFLYWVLQRWDEDANKFVDVAPLKFAYPGDMFNVSFSNARTVETIDPETHVVTKTEYFVQLRAEYTDPEKGTPTHIWWYSNFGNNDVIKKNDTDLAQNVERVGINEAVFIKPENTFTRPGYKFLGWARVESTDANGDPIPAKVHPELDEDDLFLKYVEASDGVDAHFEAQDKNGAWVPVTQVAADERLAYHDLYAVWESIPYTLTVIKNVTRTEADKDQQYSFTTTGISETDPAFTLYGQEKTSGGTITQANSTTYQIAYDDVITITETGAENFDTTIAIDNNGTTTNVTGKETGNITVRGDVTVTYTNVRKLTNVTVKKSFSGIDNLPSGFKITNTYDTTKEFTVTSAREGGDGSNDHPYSWTLENVPVGESIVFTEEGIQVSNYKLKVNNTVVGESTYSAPSLTVTQTGENTVSFTNEYERLTVPVTLKKVIDGNQADPNDEFTFTLRLVKADNEEEPVIITGLTDENGYLPSVTVSPDTSENLGDLPIGSKLIITETGADSYQTAYTTNGSNPFPITTSDKTLKYVIQPLEEGKTKIEITCGNYDNLVIPMGIFLDTVPYLALLGMVGLAVLMMFRRRKENI